ncbi:MAG TPA: SDR family NAD(P)-dependent oxidoreductase, partial [Segetibacter sp.]|nr:SDR family NAD(P)-dependent oxidoreductase [Segetibacter sp.]
MIKKIIVLGGSSGIGKAVAQRFAKEGWQVLVAAHNLSECIASVKELNGEDHIACHLDVRKDEDLVRLQQLVEENFSNFDSLVNTIGISQSHPAIN